MTTENEVCFCSVAFGHDYIKTLDRLSESITETHPESKQLFFRDCYPKNSKVHEDSLYGFKVHAVNEARALGYSKIVWVDSTIVVLKKLLHVFEHCNKYGILAVPDDNLLSNFCSNKALQYYGITREQAKELGIHFVGGSYYLFDFNVPLCVDVFNSWAEAEKNGIFGALREPLQGHRHDETCLALSMLKCGSVPISRDIIGYNTGNDDQIVVKRHFK